MACVCVHVCVCVCVRMCLSVCLSILEHSLYRPINTSVELHLDREKPRPLPVTPTLCSDPPGMNSMRMASLGGV